MKQPQHQKYNFTETAKAIQLLARSSKHSTLRRELLRWYHAHGRHDLPWRKKITDYSVFLSEIMLQQTQVPRVIEKFHAFTSAYPNFKSLAAATNAELLALWSGLGYNRRALNLKKACSQISEQHNGRAPQDFEALKGLAGIGEYTAHAMRAFAFDLPALAFDTNLRTVGTFLFFSRARKDVSDVAVKKKLLALVSPSTSAREFNYALMDFGSELKRNGLTKTLRHIRPKQSTFKGSNREARGVILKILSTSKQALTAKNMISKTSIDAKRIEDALRQLTQEKILEKIGQRYQISG